MSELEPCPFCSSGWLYETWHNGYCNDTPVMFCNSCKAVVTWEQVEEEGVNDETKAFVREHWNTRFNGSETAETSDNAPLRTCKNETRHIGYGFACSVCEWSAYMPNDYGNDVVFDFNYCPNCGAKVVGE